MKLLKLNCRTQYTLNIDCQNGHKYIVTHNSGDIGYWEERWIVEDYKKRDVLTQILRERLINFAKQELKKRKMDKKVVVVHKSVKK